MQKIIVYLVAAAAMCCAAACYKDNGNYTYHEANEVSVTKFDTAAGYVARYGDTVSVDPVVVGKLDPAGTGSYSYEWSYQMANSFVQNVISTQKNLRYKVNLAPGVYTLVFKVTDNNYGIAWHGKTSLQITTDVYEGYLVLNEVAGKSRLDMLSYQATSQQFTPITDVLKEMGSALPPQDKPVNIFCMQGFSSVADPLFYKVYLSTATGTNNLHSETFAWKETQDLSYEMIGDLPAGFRADRFCGTLRFGAIPTIYMSAGNNVFQRGNASYFPYAPLNSYAGAVALFKASPYVVANLDFAMMFNMDKRTFTRMTDFNSKTVYDMPAAQNYPTGKDLVYMEMSYTEVVHAIMKDPATGTYSIIRFYMGSAPTYNDVITATDFDKATHFAMSPDRGYLFYSVGGKVYEYDLSLKTSKLMLDKGDEEVSYLAFQNFFWRSYKTTYTNWSNLLTVGLYNTAGTEGANGTLEQYSVPAVNGQITLANQWKGFGKITSIAYRERR